MYEVNLSPLVSQLDQGKAIEVENELDGHQLRARASASVPDLESCMHSACIHPTLFPTRVVTPQLSPFRIPFSQATFIWWHAGA